MEKLKNKKPLVRFPEFEGEWEVKKLGDILIKKSSNISANTIEQNFGDYIIYGASGILKKVDFFNEENEYISIIKDGAGVGRVYLCETKTSVLGTLDILKVKKDNLNFMFFFLETFNFLKFITGSTIPHIYFSDYKNAKIQLPTIPEQTKIAHFFSVLDKKLNQLQEKKTALKLYKKGMMQKIFAAGGKSITNKPITNYKSESSEIVGSKSRKSEFLIPNYIRFKDDNGKDFPDWEFLHGNKIFERISDKKHNSDLPILAISQELGAVPRELINYTVSVTENSISSYKVVDVGDFIISLRSFQGGIEYSNYRGICSPAYIILRPTIKIEDYFYKHYLKSYKYIQQLKSKLEGIRDGKMISYKYFSEIKIPYPNLEEQTKIANFLSKIDQKIMNCELQITNTKEYKKGLLQKMFV